MDIKEWLNGNDLSLTIWEKKYQNGNETFEEWLDRVSHGYEPIKTLIREKKFLFGGRILANRGVSDKKLTYSNCYVIAPPDDTIESIFDCASKLARTYSYGGGCGIDLSNLRPCGAKTRNAAKESTGPVSFMDIFSQVTQTISQSGRRGALMISMDINHPDIEQFIDCKTDLNRVKYANISVRVNNEFMEAVVNDSDYWLRWPCDFNIQGVTTGLKVEYNELFKIGESLGPGNQVYLKKVKARELFKKLSYNNWDYAEPGILYWDRISKYNMLDNTNFEYAGVNPCAEEPLPPFGSCLLGSINLSEFVLNPFTKQAKFDYDALEKAVFTAVVGLNQVLIEGLNLHPLQEQRDCVSKWRQIGLGTFGLADMLIKLGLVYGSKESLSVIDCIYKLIATAAVEQSLELAKSHGCYAECNTNKLAKSSFITHLNLPEVVIDGIKEYGLYNSQLLTCAPTGSIATMLEASTGVEPIFAMKYTRKTQSLNGEDTFYDVYTKIAKDYLEQNKETTLPFYFVESKDISPNDRINVQATLQRWTDASISSTINLPKEATIDDVYHIYLDAWYAGLKGVTVYRSGCKREGILVTEKPKEKVKVNEEVQPLKRGEIIRAGDDCIGLKRTLMTGCGTLHVEAFFEPQTGALMETYLSKGSKGGCLNFMTGLSRMISLAARGGIPIEAILDQLKSCGTCPSYAVRCAVYKDTSKGSCCPVAVGNALRDMYNEMQGKKQPVYQDKNINKVEIKQTNEDLAECPECHEKTLIHEGGCIQCTSCGYSKCE